MKQVSLMVMAVVAILLISTSGKAQDVQTVKGKNYLNAGIGLGSFGLTGTGLPITLSLEHGITDQISVGGQLGFIRTTYNSSTRWTYYIIGARGSYHFNEILNVSNPKLDIYGGAGIFYRGWSWKDKNSSASGVSGGGIDFALHAGGRYMFGNSVGVFAEAGYGISALQLGLSVIL
jgi:hypothetical protein